MKIKILHYYIMTIRLFSQREKLSEWIIQNKQLEDITLDIFVYYICSTKCNKFIQLINITYKPL